MGASFYVVRDIFDWLVKMNVPDRSTRVEDDEWMVILSALEGN
jgi:hypothetical protein